MYTLRPRTLLRNDTYRIELVLSQNKSAITYVATDINLDKKVVVKEFFPKDLCNRKGGGTRVAVSISCDTELVTELKDKFLKEARDLAHIGHPGIIKVYAAFEENDTAYYITDYIEGKNLQEIVMSDGPMAADRAVEYIVKAGETLDFLHHHHILHLDIKPANILVRKYDDMPVLIDFAQSKLYDSEDSRASDVLAFAPLEQYYGEDGDLSPQTDLYSLAATLYFLLTGDKPPRSVKLAARPLSFPPSIPPYIAGAIRKAMALAKHDRHSSISDFLNEIQKADPDETSSAAEISGDNDATHLAVPVSKEKPQSPVINIDPPKKAKAKGHNLLKKAAFAVVLITAAGYLGWASYKAFIEITEKAGIDAEGDTAIICENETAPTMPGSLDKDDASDSDDHLTPAQMTSKGYAAYSDENFTEAFRWFSMAAERGDTDAQYQLAGMYENGKGVTQDYNEAVRWFRKLAEEGNKYAQCGLARMYYNGTGVAKDESEAKKWWMKSAAQGNEMAEYYLRNRFNMDIEHVTDTIRP